MSAGKAQNYDLMKDSAARSPRLRPQLALLIGFGGVLVLMGLAGVDSIRVLHRLEESQLELSRTYLAQHEALSNIRSAIYLSGNLVRDYLLAENEEAAARSASQLLALREEMLTALADYSAYVEPAERELFKSLREEVARYWSVLLPISDWSREDRLARQYEFLAEEGPLRRNLTDVVDKIDSINQGVVDASSANSAALFDSFRRRTTTVLFIAFGLGISFAGLSILHIVRLESEARLRYDEIVRARGELERLSARLVSAQEEERRLISREMHDEVGQSLSALLVDLGNLAAVVPEDNSEVRQHLKTARLLAESSLRSVRNMALLLRPSMLDDLGLVPALHWQAREVSRRTGIDVEVSADGVPDNLPDEHRTCVYRIVQEALNNITRHASATTVFVEASVKPERLLLSVRDDGRGFEPDKMRGAGLLGMEERVRQLRGRFRIDSRVGEGTTISIELPLGTLPA